jgi:hypothetical protein
MWETLSRSRDSPSDNEDDVKQLKQLIMGEREF